MEDPIVSDVVIENRTVVGSIFHDDSMIGTGKKDDPLGVNLDIIPNVNELNTQIQNLYDTTASIQDVIPATANTENPLVDQGFVNSSIQTATAYFRGDWATWADVPSDPSLYPVDATGNRTPTTNDYLVVITDEQTNGGTWRYKYTGLWSEQGKSGWQAEYQVNETPFTAAQNAALNSGVTAQAVSDIATNKSNITALQNGKQDKLTAGNGITIEDNVISATGGGGASLPDQTGNAGKFLKTDGTTASWGDALTNAASQDGSLAILGTTTSNNGVAIGNSANAGSGGTAVGKSAKSNGLFSVALGWTSEATSWYSVALGAQAGTGGYQAIAIGYKAKTSADRAIQIAANSIGHTNSDADTFKVGNGNGNFEMMDANGNVPLGRLTYVTNQIGDISTALTAILGE